MYLAAMQDFLHSKTCVLPLATFAHQWRGSWLLALSNQESGVYLFRGASTPSHLVTAVMPGVEADTRLLATARHTRRHTEILEHEQLRCDK